MDKVLMEHGAGGSATSELISEIFEKSFDNEILSAMEDSAVVKGAQNIVVTTDSFVVTPLEFAGGNIGRLCICGTVNDLLMRGAEPKYITCGFILQTGADIAQLKRIVKAMADTAKEAGVLVVAGDTKVIEGNGGIFINTAGVGFLKEGLTPSSISAANAADGDVIIVSGTMGDHHAAILSERIGIKNEIKSDNAPLNDIVNNLIDNGINVHTLRDITRGGLGTVLKELAESSKSCFTIKEKDIPVLPAVRDFCGLTGLDPLYMGNEGKLLAIVPGNDEKRALEIIKNSKYGENAAVIGKVTKSAQDGGDTGKVYAVTAIGGRRSVDVLHGEGLPRIC